MRIVFALAAAAALGSASASAARAGAAQFAPGFTETTVQVGATTWHYRIGGTGSPVVLLHGYGDTGDMWASLAPVLAKTHRVIVPDLPGLGLSRPAAGAATYDMASTARALHGLMASLGDTRGAVVGHDIGLMVAYAYAAQYPSEVTRLALMDAPIPGVGPWQQVLLMPGVWHFHFHGTYADALTAGRERIYLDRVWDDFAYHPERVGEAERAQTAASYAQPGNMHAGFSYFAGFDRDVVDNVRFAGTPLTMPVLAMGGDHSFGTLMPQFAKAVAVNVETSVIPDSGHWIMDENPAAATAALQMFLTES